MSRNTIEILGVNVDSITFDDAVKTAEELVKSSGVSMIFTPNPEIIMCAKEDAELKKILNEADLCICIKGFEKSCSGTCCRI